jgi:hypothetical protein
MFDLTSMDPKLRRSLTYLVQDVDNPKVQWEMGLVSARAIVIEKRYNDVVDYQVVWRLPNGAVRGSVVVKNGEVVSGNMAYFDPKKYLESGGKGHAAWTWEYFKTPEEFKLIAAKIAAEVAKLPMHEIPTIDWSRDRLCQDQTSMPKLEYPTES